jgi:hypothetical protein
VFSRAFPRIISGDMYVFMSFVWSEKDGMIEETAENRDAPPGAGEVGTGDMLGIERDSHPVEPGRCQGRNARAGQGRSLRKPPFRRFGGG